MRSWWWWTPLVNGPTSSPRLPMSPRRVQLTSSSTKSGNTMVPQSPCSRTEAPSSPPRLPSRSTKPWVSECPPLEGDLPVGPSASGYLRIYFFILLSFYFHFIVHTYLHPPIGSSVGPAGFHPSDPLGSIRRTLWVPSVGPYHIHVFILRF